MEMMVVLGGMMMAASLLLQRASYRKVKVTVK